MFARYFLELPIPVDDVEHALSRDPPWCFLLGTFDRTIDRALLSRVAEATLKDFLDRVADAIVGERATIA